jgi:hypothetical protein
MGTSHSKPSRRKDKEGGDYESSDDESIDGKNQNNTDTRKQKRMVGGYLDGRGRTKCPLPKPVRQAKTNDNATRNFPGTDERSTDEDFTSPHSKIYAGPPRMWERPGENFAKNGKPALKELNPGQLRAIRPED